MVKRQRDHKAEYRRRKLIASRAGFDSVRKYKRVRKTLSLPRTAKLTKQQIWPIAATISDIRTSNRVWSDIHSRTPNSRWNDKFNDDRAFYYHRAFVDEYGDDGDTMTKDEKLDRLHDYLVDYDLVTEDEWNENYLGLK